MSTTADGTEMYMEKIRQKATPTGDVLEKIKQDRLSELDNLRVEAEISKVKSQLSSQGGVMTPQQQNAQQPSGQALATLFVGKSPDEITKLLDNLTPEQIRKLQMITANMNSNQLGNVLEFVQKPNTSMQDMLTMFKMMLEIENMRHPQGQAPNVVTTKDLIDLFKALREPASNQVNPTEVYKLVQEATRPFADAAAKAREDAFNAKLNEIKANQPGSLGEQIEYVKEMAGALGMDKGGRSEFDLRLEEMKQNREVDIEKLRWEQEKYKLEKEGDDHKWDLIAQIVQGPVGEVLKNIGAAGAERMRPSRPNNGSSAKMPKPIQVECPNCHNQIFVDQDAMQAVCGRCGAVLQRTVQAAPPPMPPPAPIPAPPPASLENQEDSTRVEDSPATTPEVLPPSEEEEETVEEPIEEDETGVTSDVGEQQPT